MRTSLVIERIDLADTGHPVQLAELLTQQLKAQLSQLLPIPIEDVAFACGIEEIKGLHTDGFEGGLIQNEEKTSGYILVKSLSREDRRRFTIAHELGHFLNPYHVAPEGKLWCTSQDLRVTGLWDNSRLGIEAQANEFAAHLLMPPTHLKTISTLWDSPQIQSILDLQRLCNVSKEAASRQYVGMHGDSCAVVFTHESRVRYAVYGGGFPRISIDKGHPVGRKTLTHTYTAPVGSISDQEEVDSHQWLAPKDARQWNLWEEVLIQNDSYRLTLLVAEASILDEDEELIESWTPKFR